MQSWRQIIFVCIIVIGCLVLSTAQDGTAEDQAPELSSEEAHKDDGSTPSSQNDLPSQPTLRQVLESMKPPSLIDDDYEPESASLPSSIPGSDLYHSISSTGPTVTWDSADPEEGANVTDASGDPVTVDNSTATGNTTSKLCNCAPLNRTQDQWTVQLVNASVLYSELQPDGGVRARSQPGRCVLVLFYGVCCPFSAAAAPHFNAVARAFPALSCLAVEATAVENDMSLNSRFGIIAVPTVLLFHNGRPMARFNESEISLLRLADMVHAQTSLAAGALNITAADLEGPVPTTARRTFNWYLALAWAFIVACALYGGTKVQLWRRVADSVRNWWIEAVQHLHEE